MYLNVVENLYFIVCIYPVTKVSVILCQIDFLHLHFVN